EPRPAQGPRHRDDLPELRSLPAHVGLREYGVRAQDAEGAEARDLDTRRARGPGAGAGRRTQEATANSLRGPAAARRDGPRDRPRTAGVPDGRAALQPGGEAPRRDAGRDRPAAARPR